jgi:hypothetical protein
MKAAGATGRSEVSICKVEIKVITLVLAKAQLPTHGTLAKHSVSAMWIRKTEV